MGEMERREYYDENTKRTRVVWGPKRRKPKRSKLSMPYVCPDTPDYLSPVTGELISGRVQRREDLKRHDCYEMDPPTKPLMERKKEREEIILEESRELNDKLDAVINRHT